MRLLGLRGLSDICRLRLLNRRAHDFGRHLINANLCSTGDDCCDGFIRHPQHEHLTTIRPNSNALGQPTNIQLLGLRKAYNGRRRQTVSYSLHPRLKRL